MYGEHLFWQFAQDAMYLASSKRQHADQTRFLDLLEKSRCGNPSKELSLDDAEYICSFHLRQQHFTERQVKELMDDPETMFLYAINEEKDKCNMRMLKLQHSKTNPVAVIKTYSENSCGLQVSNNSKHWNESSKVLNKTLICRNAKVHLYGRNIKPEWGLFNGSQGTVKEIVYKPGESPSTNDMPQYVLVDFPQYKGPFFFRVIPR